MGNLTALAVMGEFVDVDLGHKRREQRLERVVAAIATKPDASFPEATGSDAELEGLYRLLNNRAVKPDRLLEPHVVQTVQRATVCSEPVVVVAHDTTGFVYEGSGREGLGLMLKSEQGFYGHFSLAVSPNENREPLGVLSFLPVVRKRQYASQTVTAAQRNPEKEYARWLKGIDLVEQAVGGAKRVVHVADRESDSYEIISGLVRNARGFVLRLRFDRNVMAENEATKLFTLLDSAQGVTEREVPLQFRKAPRGAASRKLHPPRDARLATLAFSAMRVRLPRTRGLLRRDYPDFVEVNVVRVWEPSPPEGEEPIEWKLVTSEPVDSPEQILKVADYYRCRWRIEEFNKALKTGCRVEGRQLIRLDALLNMIAIMTPIAWAILRLRTLANAAEPVAASVVLTAEQLSVLSAHPKTQERFPANASGTCRDALHAVAALGGHLKRNGAPGWITLLRGYKTLIDLALGWSLSRSAGS